MLNQTMTISTEQNDDDTKHKLQISLKMILIFESSTIYQYINKY